MKPWMKNAYVFLVAGAAYLAGQYFRGVWFLKYPILSVCRNSVDSAGVFCNSPYVTTLGFPLIVLGRFLAAIGIVLLLADRHSWRVWFRFSLFYVPIATALVLWIYPTKTAGFSLIGSTGYDFGVANAGWLYLFATIGIVIWTRVPPKNKVQGR